MGYKEEFSRGYNIGRDPKLLERYYQQQDDRKRINSMLGQSPEVGQMVGPRMEGIEQNAVRPVVQKQEGSGLMSGGLSSPEVATSLMQMGNPVFQKAGSGMLTDMYQPQEQGGYTFDQYMNSTPQNQSLYDRYKGRIDNAPEAPNAVREWQYYNTLGPEQQNEYKRLKRNTQYMDIGTGYVDPVSGDTVEKEIVDTKIRQGIGENTAKRLASFDSDMAVADEMKTNIAQTKIELARLSGMTDYGTTGFLSYLNVVPTADQKAWDNIKTTVQSRLGLEKLAQLKSASPSGASGFGALSERELDLLVSNMGKLDQASGPVEIKRVIQSIMRQLDGVEAKIDRSRKKQIDFYKRNSDRLPESLRATVPQAETDVIEWDSLK